MTNDSPNQELAAGSPSSTGPLVLSAEEIKRCGIFLVVKKMLYCLILLSRRWDVHILIPSKRQAPWTTANRLP